MSDAEQDLVVRLLGRPRLEWRGKPLELAVRKPLALAYVLAVRREVVPREELAELLWAPGRLGSVRSAIYTLRKEAGAGAWLRTEGADGGLRIRGDSDLDAFERRLGEGDARAALAAWRGAGITSDSHQALLQGFSVPNAPAFGEWLEVERARVSMLYLDCLSRRAAELEERGDREALALLRELVREDPLNEDAHRRIMRLAWRTGDAEAALEQFQVCRRTLAEELGLEPLPSTVELFEAIRTSRSAAPSAPYAVGGTAPAFVGRGGELIELDARLREHRLVTLLGPGGIGKTRLAREALRRSPFAASRTSAFVPLQALRSSRFVVAAVARAIGLAFRGPEEPLEQLLRTLREGPALLVLDNVEHLAGAGGVIEALLEGAPELSVLATSRRALGIPSEHRFVVGGLGFPRDEGDRGTHDAVRLFATAAAAAVPSFSASGGDESAVARVCRILRGHPLGIELAAGSLGFYGLGELADALHEDVLQLENPGLPLDERHASLRLVMERSWAALGEGERGALARLSVFRGGFDARAAEAVAGADAETLAGLVAQSLLQALPGGRYDFHPLVGEFASEKARALPGSGAVRARHARHFLGLLASRHALLLGPSPGPALDALEADFDNIREAWSHASRHGRAEDLVAAADALSLYADMRARFHEAVRLFGEAADALDGREAADRRSRAALLGEKGVHLYRLSRYAEALALARSALDELRPPADGDGALLHKLLKLQASAVYGVGDYPEARRILERALALSRRHAPERVSRDLRSLGNVEACLGNHAAAEARYREAMALDRESGYLVGVAINLNNLAELLVLVGRLEEAEGMIEESLGYAEGVDVHLVPYLELNKAELAFRRGAFARAAEHARACRSRAERYGQVGLRSRAAVLLGRVGIRGGDLEAAGRSLAEGAAIAYGARDMASLAWALVALGELALATGEEERASACLRCGLHLPASEWRTREEARRLLGAAPDPDAPPPSVEEIVEALGVA